MPDSAGSRLDPVRATTALLLLALAASGCARPVDIVALRDRPAPDDAAAADAAADGAAPADATADGAMADGAEPPPPTQLCPYLQQMPGAGTASVAELVAGGLGRAICSCSEYVGSALMVDSFDRSDGPFVLGEPGGDVGVNTALSLDGFAQIGGDLVVAGAFGVMLTPELVLSVGEDLAVGGPFEGALSTLRVAGNAEIAGRVVLGMLEVRGQLTQPAGATRNVSSGDPVIGQLLTAEVVVPPPCGCTANDLLDVARFVNDAAPSAIPLAVPPTALESRCEQYVLTELDAATLHIVVQASAALFVPGDLQIHGDLTIETAAGAELDLFVQGNLLVEGRLELGTAQGQVRIHVGGAGTIQLTRGGAMQGALYAPLSEIVLSAPFTLYGAMIARRVAATSAALTVHYDRSLGRVPEP